jgi:[ribosomal protein S18]-alanine N-acetyltransferase
MSISIRSMAQQDLERILTLSGESAEAPRWTPSDYQQLMLSDRTAPLVRCALVALSGNLVGFAVACFLQGENAAELETLMVEPAHRRQGIGSALIAACMAWADRAGASKMTLEVRASNEVALALYRHCGFSVTGMRRAYYSAPVEDAVLLQAGLALPSPGAF